MERAAIYVRTCGRGMSSAMEAGLADCRRFAEKRPAWRLTQVYLHDDTAAEWWAWQGLLRDCSQGKLERIATPSVTMLRVDMYWRICPCCREAIIRK